MADLGDKIKELEDYARTLEDTIRGVSAHGDKFVQKIQDATRASLNLNNVFEEILDTSSGLPDGMLSVEDIQKKMVKDAKFFNKIQQDTFNITQRALNEGWAKIHQHLKSIGASENEIKEAMKEHDDIVMRVTNTMDRQFKIFQRQREEAIKINAAFVDINAIMDDLGESIRHPASAVDRVLAGASQMPEKFRKTYEETGNFKKALVESIPPLKGIVGFFKFLGKAGLIVGGITLAFVALLAPLILVWKAFKQMWDFVDKKVMPATADLNKELGNMGGNMAHLRKQMVSTGVQFEMLGMSFDEGAKAVQGIASAMMTVRIPDAALQTTLKLSEYVGLGAEQAGKLALQFMKSEGDLKNLNQTMKGAGKVAAEYGVPVNQVRRDIGENIDVLQRFGTQNAMVMAKSAAKARSYGLTIREVTDAFGKQLDTFEGSAEAGAKLNTIFGTHINSYKLMLETNPMKRMEMLRGELVKQGKTWDKLSVFEKNVITQTMGVSEEQAALALSSDKVRRKLQAQIDQKKKDAKLNEDWDRGLNNIKRTLIAWEPLIDRLMRSIANFTSKLLTGKSAAEGMGTTADVVESAIESIIDFIDKATESIDNFVVKLKSLGTTTAFRVMTLGATVPLEMLSKSLGGPTLGDVAEQYFKKAQEEKKSAEQATLDLMTKFAEQQIVSLGKPIFSNDALITKHGQIIKFNPQDNILATKSKAGMAGIAGGVSATEIENVVKSVMRQMKPEIKVEIMDINLDGKKIGEAQIRISRN